MNELAKEKIIVALDVPGLREEEKLLGLLEGHALWVKVGLQLFAAAGPDAVRMAASMGFRVFLDLKIHDIPNTARAAVRSALELGAGMLTLHCLGGAAMLRASAEEAKGSECLLLGVTILTSMNEGEAASVGIPLPLSDTVSRLAGLAAESGLGGVVASPLETPELRMRFGGGLKIVTPGIRPADAELADQKRVLTPAEALRNGSDYLVIGRPITGSPDPCAAFLKISSEL